MRKELSKEELHLLAIIQKMDIKTVMSVRHLLDTKLVRSKLILSEYQEQAKDRRVLKKNIINSLMKKYSVSKAYIELIIYEKRPGNDKQCIQCEKSISTFRWNRNDGLCPACMEQKKQLENSIDDDKNRSTQGDESPKR